MRTALVGHTGFVGSNIAAAHDFDDLYNSRNLEEIAGRRYDLVVSAAARADSHRINQNEDLDRAEIEGIAAAISSARIERLVLISSVCVYPGGGSPDESTPLAGEALTPYGRNRLLLERLLASRFPATIVRLPQLFGRNMRKGIVNDLLRDHRVEHIDPGGEFQYYDLGRLWSDIELALANELASLNLATPPLPSWRVAAEVFGRDIRGQRPPEPPSRYATMYTRDMRTRHSDLVGGPAGYVASERQVLDDLRRFVRCRTADASDAVRPGGVS